MLEKNTMIQKKFFIGLKYDPFVDRAPKIQFKIQGPLSDKIINEFKKNNIPIFKDANLVNILKHLKIGEEIPEELYIVIANIYKVLYNNGYIKEKNN